MKKLEKEKLASMPYDDIAYKILESKDEKMTLQNLFNEVGKMAGIDSKLNEDKIVDFFQLLSTDKRFIMLDGGFWDLRDRHSHKIKIDEEDNLSLDEIVDDEEELIEETNNVDNTYYDEDEIEDDDSDDLKDLIVVDEDELDQDIA